MNFSDFVNNNKNKLFRYWLRKTMWTPYEMELKDPMQSDVVSEDCSYGYFVECIDLGYDWLVGISEDMPDDKYISYYKLSESKEICSTNHNS